MIVPSTTTVGIARTPYVLPSWHICLGGQRRSITLQPHDETASFTTRNVSSQIEQPAVKTSIVLFPAIPFTSFLVLRTYIPVQQHLSIVLPVNLHSNFPFFCFSQQHVFTSLPVKLHTIFGAAADAIVPIANAANSGSHFVIGFINSPPSIV